MSASPPPLIDLDFVTPPKPSSTTTEKPSENEKHAESTPPVLVGSPERKQEGDANAAATSNDGALVASRSSNSAWSLKTLHSVTSALGQKLVKIPAEAIAKQTTELTNYLLDNPDYAAIAEVFALQSHFFSDLSRTDFTLGLLAMSVAYVEQYATPHGKQVEDVSFLQDVYRGMKYASGAYGWNLLQGVMAKSNSSRIMNIVKTLPKDQDKADLQALEEHTGIPENMVIHQQWHSNNFNNGHFVAIDVPNQNIVVSFRGTFHPKDAVSDLVVKPVPFTFQNVDGTVHSGIMKCAQCKYELLAPVVEKAYQENPNFRILVVGHSLGAGVAQLWTLQAINGFMYYKLYLNISAHPDWNIMCYAYAPALVVSENLANLPSVRPYISCFCLNDDIVPRLSHGSMKALKLTLKDVLSQGRDNLVARITTSSLKKIGVGPITTKKKPEAPQLLQLFNGLDHYREDTMIPAGKVFLMRTSAGSTRGSTTCTMFNAKPEDFGRVSVSPSMLIDHMPDHYEYAFSVTLDAALYQK